MVKERRKIYDFLSVFFCIFGGYIGYANVPIYEVKNYMKIGFITLGAVMLLISLIIKIVKKELSKKQMVIALLIAVTGTMVWYRMKELYIFLLIALNFIDKDIKELMKYIFISCLTSYLFVIFMCIMGQFPDDVIMRENIARHKLGFVHPNICFRFYLPIVISGAITFNNDIRFLGVCSIISILLFILTNSRAGIVIINLFVLLALVPRKIKKKLYNPMIIPYAFLFATLLSLVLGAFSDGFETMNAWFSNRPDLWKEYIEQVKFIGNGTENINTALDNIFVRLLYSAGIIGYIFYAYLFFAATLKKGAKENYNLFALCITVFIYGLMENCTSVGECFMLLPMLISILDGDKLKELKDDCEVKEIQLIE